MKKILVDTNILLRLFLNDVPAQTKKAQKIVDQIEEGKLKVLVSILVINELVWILEKYYQQKRADLATLILDFLSLKGVQVIEVKKIYLRSILKTFEKENFDFTDCYLWFLKNKNKIPLESFDKKLLKKSK